jgi:integrase
MTHAPTMVSLVEDYLAARRQVGFALEISGAQLLAFGSFADQTLHRGPITLDLAVRWAQSARRGTPLTWARRLEVLRPFTKYRLQFDAGIAIVPTTFFGPAHRRLVPHIYTKQEIVALLQAPDNLLPVGGLRPLTYRTLFGLLAATGLRISEALHLKPQDVDLKHELLTVRQTKFRKSRLVPLDSTTAVALTRYTEARHRKLAAKRSRRSSCRIAANRYPTAPFIPLSRNCAPFWSGSHAVAMRPLAFTI